MLFDQETNPNMSGKFPTWRVPEQERDLVVKQEMLYFKMRSFNHAHINESTLYIFQDKMKFFEHAFDKFMEGIASLLLFHPDSLGADRVEDWKNVWSSTEKDADEYRRNVYRKATVVKISLVPSFPNAAPMHAQSHVTTSMSQNEKLNEMRKHDDCPRLYMYAVTVLDLIERAQQEKKSERQKKLNETCEDSLENIAALKTNIDDSITNDDLNGNGVQYNVNITMETTIHDDDDVSITVETTIHYDDVNIDVETAIHNDDVKTAVETTIQDVKFVEEAVRGEDDKRELYTLDQAKSNAIKLPTFEGRDDHLGEFPIGSYLKVTDSTKSSVTFLVLVRGIFFYII